VCLEGDATATEELRALLHAAAYSRSAGTLWVLQGIAEYLSRDQLLALLHALSEVSAPGSCLLLTYTDPLAKGIFSAHGRNYPAQCLVPVEEVMDMVAAAGWRPGAVQLAGQLEQSYGVDLAGVLHVLQVQKPAA
jgi:O-methyltransferase involved in polyketide biosynthesis